MLHEDTQMVDIDVDHWRNLQNLLLDSAKGRRRIIVIHDNGEVVKLVHSQRKPVVGIVKRVDDPHLLAEQLFRANSGSVDFVAVFERRAFDEYFGRVQATWRPTEDLDEFVHRGYQLLDEYPNEIVTYPGRARKTLGLQWRLGASYEAIKEAVQGFVLPGTTIVLGVFEGDGLWATLVLGFDQDLRVKLVTTVDPTELTAHGRQALAEASVAWVEGRYGRCSIALFTSLGGARDFLATENKRAMLLQLAAKEDLIISRMPGGLLVGSSAGFEG